MNLCRVIQFSNKCATININETSFREKSLGFSNYAYRDKEKKAKMSFCSL